jgi:hypothetical protein
MAVGGQSSQQSSPQSAWRDDGRINFHRTFLIRPFMVADWCGTVLVVIGTGWFVYLQANRGMAFALKHGLWALLPALLAMAITLWLVNRLRCAVCNCRLRGHPVKRKHPVIPSNCAKCGADFSRPMPASSSH